MGGRAHDFDEVTEKDAKWEESFGGTTGPGRYAFIVGDYHRGSDFNFDLAGGDVVVTE